MHVALEFPSGAPFDGQPQKPFFCVGAARDLGASAVISSLRRPTFPHDAPAFPMALQHFFAICCSIRHGAQHFGPLPAGHHAFPDG
jgi:hypothetical protein